MLVALAEAGPPTPAWEVTAEAGPPTPAWEVISINH
jgi:hypothetical protein